MSTGLAVDHIDDYLGDSVTRFFGSGYRRVEQRLTDVSVGASTVTATARVILPDLWSAKARGRMRPHLSTLDALVLTAQLAEAFLGGRLDREQRRSTWLRRVEIRAGNRPVEDGLDAIPVEATLTGSEPGDGAWVSTFQCRIGPMTTRAEVVHPAMAPAGTPVDNLAGKHLRLYGSGYHYLRPEVSQVVTDPGAAAATAEVRLHLEGPQPFDGIEGGQLALSMVDAFVVALQLGQVLLYELDGISRADSDTLWMRRTVLEADPPRPLPAEPLTARVALAEPLLVRSRGDVWRTATIEAECQRVRVRCAVTHRVPADSLAEAG